MNEKDISASGQDYLEAIYNLSDENGDVRSVDVAAALGFSRASVSRAMTALRGAGLIEQEKYGSIRLTKEGEAAAKKVWRAHETLKGFLTEVLGVSEEIAEADACRMEHNVSQQTLKKLLKFLKERA